LRIIDGRIITLLGVLHIPGLARNLISVRKMDDVGVKKMFEKGNLQDGSRSNGVVQREFGLELCIIYKEALLVIGCNSSIVPKIGVE
jgi:hypothetical protein